jgi:hypothetical protein
MFDALAALFRRGGSSLSVPILDGALKPNNLLEQAPVFAEHADFEDIALGADGTLHAACGSTVVRFSSTGELTTIASFDATVTALAFLPDGGLAVALGTRVVIDAGAAKSRIIDTVDGKRLTAVNALHAQADGSLLICDGSATRGYPDWSRDLMEKGSSGRLLRADRGGNTVTTLATGLGYAFGALDDGQGNILVSESWRHQVGIVKDRGPAPAIAALPGYPARMAPSARGGLWLSLFACRTQLVEFVLRESDYRREMLRTIDPKYWVAPALSSGADFLEPLQGGSVKQMGILKPWAPPRSYGLLVLFNADFIPVLSLHSRTGGRHHGVVAVAERGDDLFVLSKGAGRILRLSLSQIDAEGAQ